MNRHWLAATVICTADEPVVRVTTPVSGAYLEDARGRRGVIRFSPRRLHWLARLLG